VTNVTGATCPGSVRFSLMGGERGRRDREQFERFCAGEYRRLVGAVALILGDTDLATDAVDEALARAWNRVRRGHEIESLAAWVRVVALNVAFSQHRRRAVERKHLPAVAIKQENAGGRESSWSSSIDVRAALQSLPQRQREVAVLHYMCDLPIATIANDLGISVGTVKSSLERARATLKDALHERVEEVIVRDAS
jgi:RNA polymerase sigma-70 factor, ECF subfamily